MSLKVAVSEKEAGVFTLSLVGAIDADTYKILEKETDKVLARSPRIVIFDMEGVTYISSMGVGVILDVKRKLAASKGTAIMVNLQPQVKKVFDIINALHGEKVFSSMRELDDYLASIQRKNTGKKEKY